MRSKRQRRLALRNVVQRKERAEEAQRRREEIKASYLDIIKDQRLSTKRKLFEYLKMVGLGKQGGFSSASWRVPLGTEMEEILVNARSRTGRRVSAKQTPKNILLKAKTTTGSAFALMVLPWDVKIDRDKAREALSRVLKDNVKRFSFASKEEVKERTGYEPGQVMSLPLANEPLLVIFDKRVTQRGKDGKSPWVFVPFGEQGLKLRLRANALVRAIQKTSIHMVKIAEIGA